MTIRTSNLYARGVTPVFTGGPGDGSEGAANAMGIDGSRFTSFNIEGSAVGYVCGFASVFMNGQFTRPGSIAVVSGQGWVGDYQNKTYNNIGCLRHLMTQIRYNGNTAEGTSWLVISDSGSIEDSSNYNHWGQFVSYLKRAKMDILPHMYQDIVSGAYGYDGNQHYFHQFSGIILLLSAGGQTFDGTFSAALRDAIKSGVSVIVLQKGPYEGNANFNAVYGNLGIISNGAAYVVSTEAGEQRSKETYSDHISWTNVPSLHIQETNRVSAAYQFNVATQPGPGSMGGQTGPWLRFFSANVDMSDDTRINSPVFNRAECCVNIGDGFAVSFDVTTNPYKPDQWAAGLAKGTHRVDWASSIGGGLQNRSYIFCHTVGYQHALDTGDSGYVTINNAVYGLSRGFTVFQIRKSDRVLVDRRTYDLEAGDEGGQPGANNAALMAQFLNSIDGNYFVLVAMYDTVAKNRTRGGLPGAMYRIGASRRIFEGSKFYHRAAYNCFGSPGIGEGNAYNEMLKGTQESDPQAFFDVGYHFDRNNNPYITGTNAISPVSMNITGLFDDTKSAHMNYYKEIDSVDAQKSYGVNHNARLTDLRFKKLPMTDATDFVVSVENPCLPQPLVQSHDWIRVYNGGGAGTVNYPFANLTEYLVTTTDDPGTNELCTSHLMMNWDMFDGVGGSIAYNEAGPSHLLSCGGDRNNPSSLYFSAGESRVFQIYQRSYNLIDGTPGRDTNDWQVHWKWSGPGSQGHNIQIDAGYEYIMFAYDRFGGLELAERHFIVPEASQLPKWGANVYNQDFSNSTLFEVSRSMAANARCTKSDQGGTENGIMMIIRRPLYMSTGPSDRTGWQLTYNDQSTTLPRGGNYPITLENDYQYMVLASCGNGGFSTHHFNGWHKTFETSGWDRGGSIEAESCGRCQWSYDRTKLLTEEKTLSDNAKTYLSSALAPVGLFQVYRRPILCFEPSEIN